MPPRKQLAEVWRAAIAQRGDGLLDALAHPAVATALGAALAQSGGAEAAVDAFETARSTAGAAGLQFDLARRAALRSVARGLDFNHTAAEFLAEVTDYFVSRDLPSFVGASGRVRNVADSESLRRSLRDLARSASLVRGRVSGPKSWRRFVVGAVERLKKP